jgi:HEAT repeat protein
MLRYRVALVLTLIGTVALGLFLLWRIMESDSASIGRHRTYRRLEALRIRAAANPLDTDAVDGLVEALRSASSFRRAHAAAQLGKLGPAAARATNALVDASNGSDHYVAREAVMALGHVGPAAGVAVPDLLRIMKEQPNEDTGWFAAEAVGRIAEPNDAAVIAALEAASRSNVSSMAARAKFGLEAMRSRANGVQSVDGRVNRTQP